ncbi:MAG: VWA domain-containing protein [Chitinophagales bacterium]
MKGYRFTEFNEKDNKKSPFEKLFDLFKELLVYTSGDVSEALSWLTELDKEYGLTSSGYGMGDFIEDLKEKGLVSDGKEKGSLKITAKTEQNIRKSALEQIFGKMKKSTRGNHKTKYSGTGDEVSPNLKQFQFGDSLDNIAMTESMKNAFVNHGIDNFQMSGEDLVIRDTEFQTRSSTVLMIDISHSMILYGEDRITPAKKVAMALAELISKKYPKDTLDIIVFGNDSWEIQIRDLPYLQVGPYHTNTVSGLELAMNILRRKKGNNKQIFMITDGKPTCLKEPDGTYYKNSFGLDQKILNKTYNLARQCRRLKIPITTFMIASDPYLKEFVRTFTEINKGKAFYSGLRGLADLVFEDFERNKRKNL